METAVSPGRSAPHRGTAIGRPGCLCHQNRLSSSHYAMCSRLCVRLPHWGQTKYRAGKARSGHYRTLAYLIKRSRGNLGRSSPVTVHNSVKTGFNWLRYRPGPVMITSGPLTYSPETVRLISVAAGRCRCRVCDRKVGLSFME